MVELTDSGFEPQTSGTDSNFLTTELIERFNQDVAMFYCFETAAWLILDDACIERHINFLLCGLFRSIYQFIDFNIMRSINSFRCLYD